MKIIFGMYTVSRKSRKICEYIYLEHVNVQSFDRFDGFKELIRFYDHSSVPL